MTKNYETSIIVTPVLTKEVLKETIAGYVDFLKNSGCEIVHQESWGLRQLAYPIKKKTSGFYHTIEYNTQKGDVIDKLELTLRRDENILRFLSVSLDKFALEYNDKKRQGLVGKKKKEEAKTEEA